LLALAPGWGFTTAWAQVEKPEDVLKSHGLSLKRGSSTYVLAAEVEVQSKLNDAIRVYKQLSFALMRQQDFEQQAARARRIVPELLEERILRNQQLQAINPQDVIAHNQLVARINEINDQLRLIDGATADPRLKQEIDKEVSSRRANYIQAILDLRALVDATTRQYADLAKDEKITTAIAALTSKSRSPLKLGPTRGFDDSVKQLVTREKSVLSKSVEMKQRGGVFEVDVTLNGKETTPMIFDTGASLVTLSAEFAAKIGLNPQSTDPTVHLHDATGGVTEAKKMTISSVRVGPFAVKNVECAVMPPDKHDVPLLLGQSFISQFTHKVDNGRLLLSKVEAPEVHQAQPARTTKKTTRGKRPSKAAVTADPDSSL
jgi:aspartyl protease family protein